MTSPSQTALMQFSDALAELTAATTPVAVAIDIGGRGARNGVLWRPDVVVASEQSLPKAAEATILRGDGSRIKARVAGRDRGTNVAVLKLEGSVAAALPKPGEPKLGALALTVGSNGEGGATARLGLVRSLGGAWRSMHGGAIDRRIMLDLMIAPGQDGAAVVNAAGELLGVTATGPRGRALVIPPAAIERVIDPLLSQGRVPHGWLGLALHPVAVPEAIRASAGQEAGMMVMGLAAGGPAAAAGVLVGDILLSVDGAPVERMRRLAEKLGPESVGRNVALKLGRANEIVTLTATVTARKDE